MQPRPSSTWVLTLLGILGMIWTIINLNRRSDSNWTNVHTLIRARLGRNCSTELLSDRRRSSIILRINRNLWSLWSLYRSWSTCDSAGHRSELLVWTNTWSCAGECSVSLLGLTLQWKPGFGNSCPSGLESWRITDDYHTPILTWRKFVSVRKGEQSYFTGNFGLVNVSKGESKVRAMVDRPTLKATHFGSSAITSPSFKIYTSILRGTKSVPREPKQEPLPLKVYSSVSQGKFFSQYSIVSRHLPNLIIRNIYTSCLSTLNFSTITESAQAWSINKWCRLSYSILRYSLCRYLGKARPMSRA